MNATAHRDTLYRCLDKLLKHKNDSWLNAEQ